MKRKDMSEDIKLRSCIKEINRKFKVKFPRPSTPKEVFDLETDTDIQNFLYAVLNDKTPYSSKDYVLWSKRRNILENINISGQKALNSTNVYEKRERLTYFNLLINSNNAFDIAFLNK